jgi:hypothetical protein
MTVDWREGFFFFFFFKVVYKFHACDVWRPFFFILFFVLLSCHRDRVSVFNIIVYMY